MTVSKRLEAIINKTKGINTLLDIGCDHGLVIYKAFTNNYIKKAIAADINIGPLNQAKNTLKDYPVKYYLTSGFKGIDDEFDGVVIAGMGSLLIVDILGDAPKSNNIKYILQANNKYEILREYLNSNNFIITDEEIIYDKHYYIIITATKGNETLSKEDIYLGPFLRKDRSSLKYYKHLYNHFSKISKQAGFNNNIITENLEMLSKTIDILSIQ